MLAADHTHRPPITSCIPPAAVLPPGIMEAHQAKLNFFTAETCNHILEQLVGHYLLLTDEELTLWSEDPEEYGEEKMSLTSCAVSGALVGVAKEKPGDNMDCSVRVSLGCLSLHLSLAAQWCVCV